MKKNAIKYISKSLVIAALTASFGSAHAGSATANLSVTASVANNCTISTTSLGFTSYDPVSGGNVIASGTVIVACTKNASSLWIGLDTGVNPVVSQRNLYGTTNHDKLAYNLMQPTTTVPAAVCPAYGAGTPWTNLIAGGLTLTTPTGKATRTYNVCGQIASGQDVSVDSYTDTIIATINF